MKKQRTWQGPLGKLMKEHLDLRAAVGRVSVADGIVLDQFNRVILKKFPGARTVKREMIVAYLKSRPKLGPWGRRNAVIYIRHFCRFLRQRGIPTYQPDYTLIPKLTYRVRYHRFTTAEVSALIKELSQYAPGEMLVGETQAVMVGLIWCAGLRVSEAVRLDHGDVDLEANTLLIRMTKFRKTRMVPITASTAERIRTYIERKKEHGYGTTRDSPLFVGHVGKRIQATYLRYYFKKAIKTLKIGANERDTPRIHDLRHSFATENLGRFYKEPEEYPPQAYTSVLATFLGHGDLKYTQYYLHPDFDLLQLAGAQLEERVRKALK